MRRLTYDILDAGPRSRFTVNGRLVHNCTGEGPQPTNSPKAGPDLVRCGSFVKGKLVDGTGCGRHYGPTLAACPWCRRAAVPAPPSGGDKRLHEWSPAAAEDAIEVLRGGSLDAVERVFGDAMHTIAGCIRGLYVAAPGHDLISTDYNSIEAVGLAMISGEAWRIEVFRSHGKIYEASASTMFGVPFEEFAAWKDRTGQHHPLRQKGKVAELACLAGDTRVLTRRGYVPLLHVRDNDQLWDGVEWVNHAGVVSKGERQTIVLGGARMTPDHKVRCGDSWKAASQLASCASTLSQALAIGSANLPSWAASGATGFSFGALVGRATRRFFSRTCAKVARPAARSAGTRAAGAPLFGTAALLTSFPTRRTANDYSDASAPPSADATTQVMPPGQTTGAAGFLSPKNGETTAERSSHTWSRCRAGITRALKWIAKTWMVLTRRGTSGSSHEAPTHATSAASRTCRPASPNLSAVYDIALAGPRSRFTIRTDAGHLIVHNCGYQGWLGAAHAFEFPGTDEEIKAAILAWRKASPAIVWLWGGQTLGVASDLRGDGVTDRWDRTPYYFGVEGACVQAIGNPGTEYPVRRLDGTDAGIAFLMRGDVLYCRIPSGRWLTYHRPRLEESERGGVAISYEGNNTNPKNGPVGWIRMRTWGGRLVENCVAEGTLVLTQRGWAAIEQVLADDLVHDGVEFVRHAGLVGKGPQPCVSVDHVWMTPDHEVLTDDGWRAAETSPRPYRPTLREHNAAIPSGEQLAGRPAADRAERREQRVFDILDCGPRSRFVVLGGEGPFIVHNCNQATCRDILRHACINLEQRGYPVVLHVYDEIVCEIPEGFGSLEEFEAIVTVPPFWAREWPIRAPGPWRAKRYRKG